VQLEQTVLSNNDQNVAATAIASGLNAAHDNDLNDVWRKVGACSTLGGIVVTDMARISAFAGGQAFHSFFILDGKYLDILREYASYSAMFESGRTKELPPDAVDRIVRAHNTTNGSAAQGLIYRLANLTSAERTRADLFFDDLGGLILFHELGHLYFYHLLLQLRARGGSIPPVILYTSVAEDSGDQLSGMLHARARLPFELALDAYDILAYYRLERLRQLTTIRQVLDPAYQNAKQSANYSSLATRKAVFRDGRDRMLRYLATPPSMSARGSGLQIEPSPIPLPPLDRLSTTPACCAHPVPPLELPSEPPACVVPAGRIGL
jgi:hypothetical protein